MNRILTELFNSTIQDEDPEHIGRVYLVDGEGTTAHGSVGGSSKSDIESKTREKLELEQELVKVEKQEQGSINHPLR